MPSSELDERADRAVEGLRDAGPAPSPSIPRYEILGRVGQGASGEVFRARDRELGRTVALKVLRESLLSDTEVRARFLREARVAAGLVHPNVVALHDAGEDDGRPYLVMEFVEGTPLTALLNAGQLDLRARVVLLAKAARGLAVAHAGGIVHRDMKPANILVTKSGEPKVGDFGLAHVQGAPVGLTRTGAVLGTPLYMAPEQIRQAPEGITPRTDVWALGAILYQMITGRPPHEAGSATELFDLILNYEPIAPRRALPSVSVELETICLKSLEREPGLRYESAAGLADDLERWLDGRPILARPPGPALRAFRWVRARKAVVAAATAGLLAIVAVATAVLERRRADAPDEAAALFAAALPCIEAAEKARYHGGPLPVTDALASIDKGLARQGSDPVGHGLRGRALELEGDLPAAEAAYRRAVELRPDDGLLRFRLGRLLAFRAGLRNVAAGRPGFEDLAPAVAEFQARVKDLFSQATVYQLGFVRLLIYSHGGDGASADRLVRDSAKRSSEPGMEDFLWARALLAEEPVRLELFDQALALAPGHWPSLAGRALERFRRGDRDGARTDAERACLLAPKLPASLGALQDIRAR